MNTQNAATSRLARAALLLVSLCAAPSRLAADPTPVTLDTPREFSKISSRAEWQNRAREIREQVMASCGLWPMPEKTPLHAQIFGKIEREGYYVEKVYFQTLPGFYLAGNLYRPLGRGNGPFPGILNPHGHWNEGRLADTKDGSIAARCISFARQGMIAFSYDMAGYNDTHFPSATPSKSLYNTHRQFGTNQADMLWSISLMGLQTWNSIRALDFLEALPGVDRKRLACTGESGGGTQTYMLGAVDDRLAAQAPVVMVSHTMQGGCSCENAPGLRVEYSNMEIAAAAAPRPQILVAAAGDWTKTTMTVEGPAIQRIYDLFHAPEKLRYVRFDFNHNYNQTSREAVYEWFGKWLGRNPDPASLKETAYLKEPDSALRVFPDGNLPADAVSEAQLKGWMRQRTAAQLAALRPTGKRGLEKYQAVMLPAWKHTLQVDWPLKEAPRFKRMESASEKEARGYVIGSGVEVKVFGGKAGGRMVVLSGIWRSLAEFPGGKMLLDKGFGVVMVSKFSTGEAADQWAKFFTTYNRTEAQERVRDLISVCAFARGELKARQVVLCGTGRAGLWTLLAAPAADAVVADCGQLDLSSDEALLAPDLLCPGIRSIGGFEGAALLAAPHPLLLHNTGAKFPTEGLRSTYEGLGAARKLRVEAGALAAAEAARWMARLW